MKAVVKCDTILHNGVYYIKGKPIDLPDETAKQLSENGLVELTNEPVIEKKPEPVIKPTPPKSELIIPKKAIEPVKLPEIEEPVKVEEKKSEPVIENKPEPKKEIPVKKEVKKPAKIKKLAKKDPFTKKKGKN